MGHLLGIDGDTIITRDSGERQGLRDGVRENEEKKTGEILERCTFANCKGTPFLIQVYRNFLIFQGEN